MGPGLGDLAVQVVDGGADLAEVVEHAFLPVAQFAVLLPHAGRAVGDVFQDLAVPALLHLGLRRDLGVGSASIRRLSPTSPMIFLMSRRATHLHPPFAMTRTSRSVLP
ncbi:hypothetical protein [Streptomyces griseorubiginosus]|uniref:hypothetical protein n=1 Tax=Streptomyces griseorubiginosus TaxID=67304 RepID=UPI001AD6F39D|nr:hypothetical protein [Streptomyces griseorubiginosus]MBO4259657.1 hypothetical protein [Streptomyces griseorubiginosus]